MVVICTMKAWFIPNTPMKILLEEHKFMFRGVMVVIPQGYAFDGLSIPQWLQWVVDMNQSGNIEAGLHHDFFYSKLAKYICTRKESDQNLKLELKAGKISKNIVYAGVRVFGKSSYQKDSNYLKYKKEIKEYREKMWMRISIS